MLKGRINRRAFEGISEMATTAINDAMKSGKRLFKSDHLRFCMDGLFFHYVPAELIEELNFYDLVESAGGAEYFPSRRAWKSKEKLLAISDSYVLPFIPEDELEFLTRHKVGHGFKITITGHPGRRFYVDILNPIGAEGWGRVFDEADQLILNFYLKGLVDNWRIGGKNVIEKMDVDSILNCVLSQKILAGTLTERAERISRRKN